MSNEKKIPTKNYFSHLLGGYLSESQDIMSDAAFVNKAMGFFSTFACEWAVDEAFMDMDEGQNFLKKLSLKEGEPELSDYNEFVIYELGLLVVLMRRVRELQANLREVMEKNAQRLSDKLSVIRPESFKVGSREEVEEMVKGAKKTKH